MVSTLHASRISAAFLQVGRTVALILQVRALRLGGVLEFGPEALREAGIRTQSLNVLRYSVHCHCAQDHSPP